MGRKLNISQPAVIQTELRPLDENFWIDANGSLEQWYYQNTNVFAPDRQVTPLILTPYLSVIDRDTNITYVPNSSNNWVKKVVGQEPEVIPNSSAFQLDHWEVKEYVDGAWVTTTITSQSQTADYVLSGLNLIVRKNNYDATHAITITCKATYNDPRDAGAQHGVQESAMLVTSVDATQAFPKIDIVNPATRTYNPLKDESPVFEFEGKADWDGVEAQGGTAITECKVDPLGTEQILPTNDEMVINAAPLLNIHYGDIEKANQQFMYRQTANGEVGEIVGGVSAIDNIKGNTVVWNQLVQNSNLNPSPEVLGITRTINGNALHYSGTSTDETNFTGCHIPNGIVSNHKYYTACKGIPSSCRINSSSTSGQDSDIITGEVNYGVIIPVGVTIDNDVYFIVFDLTLMFGAGNEPSTVEEFETWLANNVGLKDYYEYCSGKLVNFGGYGVKWNQICNTKSGANTNVDSRDNSNSPVIIFCDGSQVLYSEFVLAPKVVSTVVNIPSNASFFAIRRNGMATDYYVILPNVIEISKILNHKLFVRTDITSVNYATIGGYQWDNTIVIDLTEMFGAGNEPDLDWCNKYLSKDYYPYCPSVEKNILDVMTTKEVVDGLAQYKTLPMGMKTVGFNLWDEELKLGYWDGEDGEYHYMATQMCSVNPIPILPNTSYYKEANEGAVTIVFYDKNMECLGYRYMYDGEIVFPDNCAFIHLNFEGTYGLTYKHDTCVNISNPSKNGTYEAHWESFSDMSWITKIGIENFNIWDEEWEQGEIGGDGSMIVSSDRIRSKNFIAVNSSYTFYTNIRLIVHCYGSGKNYLRVIDTASASTFNVQSDVKYIKFNTSNVYGNTYNHDICINLSNDHFNGRYYPHGETAPYFPNGLCKAGSVCDEVKVVGGKIKGVVRLGSVDLGGCTWVKDNYGQTFSTTSITNAAATGYSVLANAICGKYKVTTWSNCVEVGADKTFCIRMDVPALCVSDSSYSDATAFKSAMQGVMLYYELATPYEFEIDYPTKGQFMWYGVDGSNNEVPIDQLPIYSQATQPSGYGQGTSRININALYGENITVMLRVKRYPWSPTVLPPKVTKSVAWSVPPIDVITTCDKGSAVRATNSSENFIFGTIVNQQGEIISEEKKAENMVFDWYMVKYGTSGAVKTSQGSGLTKSIPASTLKNTTPNGGVTPSTNVYCEAFLLGAYHLVNGQYVRT